MSKAAENSLSINPRSVNPWVIALAVTLAAFMETLDTSIANVALPYIGGGLGRSYDEVTWILTTYLVAKRRTEESGNGVEIELTTADPARRRDA